MVIPLRVALFVASLAAVGGCSNPTAPPSGTASVAGTWFRVPDAVLPNTIRFAIAQSGASLSGTWGTTTNGGTLSGNVNGISVSMIATSLDPPASCPFSVTATVNRSGTQMSGTLSVTTNTAICNLSSTGSITLTKQ
jgi:hypothetical protein